MKVVSIFLSHHISQNVKLFLWSNTQKYFIQNSITFLTTSYLVLSIRFLMEKSLAMKSKMKSELDSTNRRATNAITVPLIYSYIYTNVSQHIATDSHEVKSWKQWHHKSKSILKKLKQLNLIVTFTIFHSRLGLTDISNLSEDTVLERRHTFLKCHTEYKLNEEGVNVSLALRLNELWPFEKRKTGLPFSTRHL